MCSDLNVAHSTLSSVQIQIPSRQLTFICCSLNESSYVLCNSHSISLSKFNNIGAQVSNLNAIVHSFLVVLDHRLEMFTGT